MSRKTKIGWDEYELSSDELNMLNDFEAIDIDGLDNMEMDPPTDDTENQVEESEQDAELADAEADMHYSMGFDAGYITGYDEGQKTLAMEQESAIYNSALSDIIKHIDRFEFAEKQSVLMVLQLLQRV